MTAGALNESEERTLRQWGGYFGQILAEVRKVHLSEEEKNVHLVKRVEVCCLFL